MNMNMNNNNEDIEMNNNYDIHKLDYSSLPKASKVSIRYIGAKKDKETGKGMISGHLVMVKAMGEWRAEGEWLILAKMKTQTTSGIYRTISKAKEAKARILEKWGMEKKKEKTTSKRKTKRSEEVKALKAEIAALKAEILAKRNQKNSLI